MSDTSPLASILPDLITDSPAIRARLEERLLDLIDDTFDVLTDTLEVGDRASQQALAKQLLPVMLKIRNDRDEVDTAEAASIHEQTRAMISSLGEELPTGPELDTSIPDLVLGDELAATQGAE